MNNSLSLRQPRAQWREWLLARERGAGSLLVWLWAALLLLAVGLPLLAILGKALLGRDGSFAGLAHFLAVLASPGLIRAAQNSFFLALAATAIVLPLAFAFAWALVRSCAPWRPLFRQLALIPLLAPSLMPAISIIYLFGNQGLLRDWLAGASVYGFGGILLGEVFYVFPHALMILLTALVTADARLYEAARSMGAGRIRQFFSITLPGVRYGVVSAAMVVFTLVITDFGVPKVIGGDFSVLAVEAYKQVIGQQNFERGAVIGLILLLPAVLSFMVERHLARRQQAALTARAVPYLPAANVGRDSLAFVVLALIAAGLLLLLGMAVLASFIRYWPYEMTLTLAHYQFDQVSGGGWVAWYNSLQLALATALGGGLLVMLGAVWSARLPVAPRGRQWLRFFAMLPMAVPGLVLGLGYVFFFNHPANPLSGLYGSLTLMVICTVAHFYTTAHLTAATALSQLDHEFESVAASLKVPFWVTLWRVTLPVSLPALIDIMRYFFVSAMTTVSALIFLSSPQVSLAALSIVSMEDAGDVASAAAMSTLVMATSALASLLLSGLNHWLGRRGQRWRQR